MRWCLVAWVAVVAPMMIGCAPASPGPTEESEESGCSSLRVFIDSPAEDEISETWSTQVSGRVEGDLDLRGLHYEVDGKGLGLPAITGPFTFAAWTDRRPEVRVAVQARSVEGCVARAERVIRFDTTRWVELMQDDRWVEKNVAAPGEEVQVHWRTKVSEYPWSADARELVGGRYIPLTMRTGEGTVTLTARNRDLEVWWFNLGVSPGVSLLAISVGTSLELVPSRVEVGVGESQWLSISNAMDAEWSVEPAAVLEPVPARTTWGGGLIRAGARFEATRPGTYTVRVRSVDGSRVGEATIEVKPIEPAAATVRRLPWFPEGFSGYAFAALPDGSLLAGGLLGHEPFLLRLPRGGSEWISYAEVGSNFRAITHLVVGPAGEVFVLTDGVDRVSPGGVVDRILGPEQVKYSIDGIWGAGGTLYAVGRDWTYAFNPESGAWRDVELREVCRDIALAGDGRGLWHACKGGTRLGGMGASVGSLAPIFGLEIDGEGRVIAATTRGIHRLADDLESWEQMGGGGPSEDRLGDMRPVLLKSGARLFAADRSGLWTLPRSAGSWVRVPVSTPQVPFFVALPDGGVVMGGAWEDGPDLVEVTIGE